MVRLLPGVALMWALVGCSFDGAGLSARECAADSDCSEGSRCLAGYCTDGVDAVLDVSDGAEEVVECGGQTCAAGLDCCDEVCVDLGSDALHCGACGLFCGEGEACEAGVCTCGERAGEGTPACNTFTEACCEGICTGVDADVANCGGCGVACGTDEICAFGQCACSTGEVDCNGDPEDGCEVDLLTSVEHCGSCGEPCEAGELCCGGQCFSTESDAFNCGGCGVVCGASQLCAGGTCVCRSGLGDCDEDPGECETPLTTSEGDCGACGVACDEGEDCFGGLCQCDGAVCGADEACCAVEEGALACVDLQTSFANCGGCGVSCGSGERCVDGVCVCGDTVAAASGGACDAGGGEACCPNDAGLSVCADVEGAFCTCGGGPRCEAGLTCCDEGCADVLSDPANCGSCGATCPEGEVCEAGACRCPAGTTRCGDACVDLLSDDDNCGACGATCRAGDRASGASCEAGVCVQDCESDWADCTSASGCETYLDSKNSCGQDCGTVVDCGSGIDLCVDNNRCQCDLLVWVRCNPGERCVSYGSCGCGSGGACGDGEWCCGSACVDVSSDPSNCGGCGVVCASGSCSGGACQ